MRSSLLFFSERCRAFPVRIRQLQSDNGAECPFAFSLTVQEAGIRYRDLTPRRPQQTGTVERRHRIDSEACWGRHTFSAFSTAAAQLRAWERTYNHERFSLVLAGRTPAEKLASFTPITQVACAMSGATLPHIPSSSTGVPDLTS